ncbi:MAG TPA: cytochrome c biogenesis protein CcdA, partial [Pilimelia sp.]|nr:cytochrome c biogenesis protein CcdA [Pilimelia sp.]
MSAAPLLLALTAGMLGAVNPCGFALLPAYLSVFVATDPGGPARGGPARYGPARYGPVRRALACSAALTAGYAAVFGAFGLLVTSVAGWLQPRLPWLTVGLGVLLVGLGGWLVAGRSVPVPGVRAPRAGRSLPAMALFGAAYALASLSCTIGPFLAIVVSTLRAGSAADGLALFFAYALGMGLVVAVTALAVALVRTAAVARLRRLTAAVPRVGGAVLAATGGYVAYYGWYELRLAADPRSAVGDPVIGA